MATKYVLDSCALLAYIYNEIGDDVVKTIMNQADEGKAILYMNKINLFEAYYDITRAEGLQRAEGFYDMVKKSSINVINCISDAVFREARRIKLKYKMSLADSIALGETFSQNASILTSDHREFDPVEQSETINFTWIR